MQGVLVNKNNHCPNTQSLYENDITFFKRLKKNYHFFQFYNAFTTKETETNKNNIGIFVSMTVLTLVAIIVFVASIVIYKRTYAKKVCPYEITNYIYN